MNIKNLFHPWRQNVALHATLITKEVIRIDGNTRDMVPMDNQPSADPVRLAEQVTSLKLKCPGKTHDGIEVFVNIELIGPPYLLQQFQFAEGKHVGLVLRVID